MSRRRPRSKSKRTREVERGPIDPLKILVTADTFRRNALVVMQQVTPGWTAEKAMLASLTSFVLDSLALELYFKCLSVLEGNPPTAKHDLKFLFDRLSPATQEAIRAGATPAFAAFWAQIVATCHQSNTPLPRELNFDSALEGSRYAHDVFRYLYEQPQFAETWFGGPMLGPARRRIVELLAPAAPLGEAPSALPGSSTHALPASTDPPAVGPGIAESFILMFREADLHRDAARVLTRSEPTGVLLSRALLEALSLATFLKCLIAVETMRRATGHNLRWLFDQTSAASQSAVRAYAAPHIARAEPQYRALLEKTGVNPVPLIDFDFILDAGANAFAQFRDVDQWPIITAPDVVGPFWAGTVILECVRMRILDLRPDFQPPVIRAWPPTTIVSV